MADESYGEDFDEYVDDFDDPVPVNPLPVTVPVTTTTQAPILTVPKPQSATSKPKPGIMSAPPAKMSSDARSALRSRASKSSVGRVNASSLMVDTKTLGTDIRKYKALIEKLRQQLTNALHGDRHVELQNLVVEKSREIKALQEENKSLKNINQDQARALHNLESADVPKIIKSFHEEQRALKEQLLRTQQRATAAEAQIRALNERAVKFEDEAKKQAALVEQKGISEEAIKKAEQMSREREVHLKTIEDLNHQVAVLKHAKETSDAKNLRELAETKRALEALRRDSATLNMSVMEREKEILLQAGSRRLKPPVPSQSSAAVTPIKTAKSPSQVVEEKPKSKFKFPSTTNTGSVSPTPSSPPPPSKLNSAVAKDNEYDTEPTKITAGDDNLDDYTADDFETDDLSDDDGGDAGSFVTQPADPAPAPVRPEFGFAKKTSKPWKQQP